MRNYNLTSPMRPRALLHATAMCLLLAAATVWAQPARLISEALRGSIIEKPALLGSRGQLGESTFKTLEMAGPQLKLLQKTPPGFSPPAIVKGSVKQFATGFEAGFRNPDRFLSEVQPDLLSEWKNIPRDKRIFVIGAGKDSAEVSEIAESLKSDGYAVFFYKVCSEGGGAHTRPLERCLLSPAGPWCMKLHPPSSVNTSRLRSRQRGS